MSPFPVQKGVTSAPNPPPTLLVVVDTEEEFDWAASFGAENTSVENIQHQHLAQRVFDEHGIKPTYVVDYPVASTPASAAVLRSFLEAGRCEVGAHLHPWVNPPAEERVDAFNSYACNLPTELMRRKLEALSEAIERNIGQRPVVYKAGRYGVDGCTPDVLCSLGYRVDASVVPHTDFSLDGGPDFRAMPDGPFLAAEGLLEIPLSVNFVGRAAAAGSRLYPWLERARRFRLPGVAARLGVLERLRLSPEGHSRHDMIRQTKAALARGQQYFVLTYHSSSLMPGGSPYSSTAEARDDLLQTLTKYLQFFMNLPSAKTTTAGALADSILARPTARHCFAASA